ncbi:MAG: anthranilate phosphoribosyltransferase [Phycisphaerales bacterium]|nr:anthranilate phosphoribosyltransferase [Phycisphaerales bacterium]
MSLELSQLLPALASGRTLSEHEAEAAFDWLLSGNFDDAQIAAMLALIQMRGATVDELVGAARVMRRNVARVAPRDGPPIIDTCGTGGTPKTFNVSTAAAIVAAAAGAGKIRVAKHGNRSRSGRGSAEVLQALGVNVNATPDIEARCLDVVGVCFCFAIHHHPAMKHAAGPRKSLGFPTIFNLLGPLTNPAGATRQLIGVYRPELVSLVAAALARLGTQSAMVVHGSDGLDEITTRGNTLVATVLNGAVLTYELNPAGLGLAAQASTDLTASSVEHSAQIVRDVLAGKPGSHADIVLINAAAALVVGGVASGLDEGVEMSRRAIASGAATRVLKDLVTVSNG